MYCHVLFIGQDSELLHLKPKIPFNIQGHAYILLQYNFKLICTAQYVFRYKLSYNTFYKHNKNMKLYNVICSSDSSQKK